MSALRLRVFYYRFIQGDDPEASPSRHAGFQPSIRAGRIEGIEFTRESILSQDTHMEVTSTAVSHGAPTLEAHFEWLFGVLNGQAGDHFLFQVAKIVAPTVGHTSMSIGDAIVVESYDDPDAPPRVFLVESLGFMELNDGTPSPTPEDER